MGVFQNVVVGYDGSETADRALELAGEVARESGGTLHVVVATREAGAIAAAGGGLLGGPDIAGRLVAEEAAARVVSTLTAAGVEARSRVMLGEPAQVILDTANDVGADLIVVGSKGMHGARRVLGSVPNSVAHGATCAVLIAKTD